MIKIETFTLGALQTNAYLLLNDTGDKGVIVDPGMNPRRLLERIAGLDIEAILLTHAHFDHMAGLEAVRKAANCPVYLHDLEANWLMDSKLNGSARWPDVTEPIVAEPAEHALAEGQQLQLLGKVFKVLHTPGHSPGSVSFLCGSQLIAGDVLFRNSVGRTDLPGGRMQDLEYSIRHKLYKLSPEVKVYPGHGPVTTIGHEMQYNPYVPA